MGRNVDGQGTQYQTQKGLREHTFESLKADFS